MNNATGYSDVEWAWAGVVFVIALTFFFWWGYESEDDVKAAAYRAEVAHVIVSGKTLLRDHLKDGDSAKISGVRAFTSTGLACGKVNAKNGFGAYSGEQRFLVSTRDGSVLLESMATKQAMDSWPVLCK